MNTQENQYVAKLRFKTPYSKGQNQVLKENLTVVIAENLKRIRKQKNFTQQEVSDKAGLHLTYVGHLEQGTYHPSTFVLWKIAEVLKVSVNELVY